MTPRFARLEIVSRSFPLAAAFAARSMAREIAHAFSGENKTQYKCLMTIGGIARRHTTKIPKRAIMASKVETAQNAVFIKSNRRIQNGILQFESHTWNHHANES